jgi:hypothetical protein
MQYHRRTTTLVAGWMVKKLGEFVFDVRDSTPIVRI